MQTSRLLLLFARAGVVSQTAAISQTATSNGEMHRFRSSILPSNRGQLARYGGRQTVTVLPGDGIGPEMIKHVKDIFDFAHVPVDFEEVPLSSQLRARRATSTTPSWPLSATESLLRAASRPNSTTSSSSRAIWNSVAGSTSTPTFSRASPCPRSPPVTTVSTSS
ncbi:hypothetical protein L596_024770 [Steinernema carpocapsae]|uniref:Isopropylmalate dehydrogenase-like domain-containing protein n=1 Tax=Steinernema carpocapsae TaxID=34508 RepID=A0A4U5M5P8_STECR|nr:hypothetical protein L596_024770 [Steinernema carpocapsae]